MVHKRTKFENLNGEIAMEKAPSAKQEKIERIEFLESEIKDLRKQLENFELDPDDYSEQFDDFLNEEGDAIKICGCFYSRSEILKEVDPINYRCSLNDFIDAIDLEDTEEYKNLEDKLSELEDELENLISEEE
jgi:vacuolar-type H+-ATPase subunit I/STV1